MVDEGYPRCGFAADIAALAVVRAQPALRAPVRLVTPPHTTIPLLRRLRSSISRVLTGSSKASGKCWQLKAVAGNIQAIVMPKLGLSMTEGVVAKWHVEAGARVAPGDVIADIEPARSSMSWRCIAPA